MNVNIFIMNVNIFIMNHDECEHFDPECGDNDFDEYLVTPRAPFYVQD